MGCRVHVVKKQREYGNSEAFNWKYSEFYSMLSNLGCNVYSPDDMGESNFAEMQVSEYRAALNILESLRDGKEIDDADLTALNMSAEDFNADIKDNVMQYIESLGYELKDLCVVMEQFYEQRDQNSDWIQFEAF